MITDRQVGPNGSFNHTFIMGEGIKTVLSMVLPHAALTDSAETEIRVGQMHNRIIHATAAEGYIFDYFLFGFSVFGK